MSTSRSWEDVYRVQTERITELERENAALRNEIARLNSQTMWICSCGGTDCAGQKENAALRSILTLIRSTTDESGLSQARVIETVGKYCDEVLGEETRI